MLYGTHPFEGNSESEIVNKVVHEELRFPKTPKTSNLCKLVIVKLLEKNPGYRIEMTHEILDAWFTENDE